MWAHRRRKGRRNEAGTSHNEPQLLSWFIFVFSSFLDLTNHPELNSHVARRSSPPQRDMGRFFQKEGYGIGKEEPGETEGVQGQQVRHEIGPRHLLWLVFTLLSFLEPTLNPLKCIAKRTAMARLETTRTMATTT